jgi:drug/metabolite transporter (DMT)-like permease
MNNTALLLVLVAAFIHAGWNFLSKKASGGAAFVWLFGLITTILYLPLALGVYLWQKPDLGWQAWLFMLGSGLIHTGYFLMLQHGYRVGDLSVVYPLARGAGPALSTILAIIILSERPTPLALAGTGLIVTGVFIIAGGGRGVRLRNLGQSMLLGLATGCFIAVYTIWDKYAVATIMIPPLILDYAAGASRFVYLTPYARRHWPEVVRLWREHRGQVIGTAILSPISYILVLTAMTFTQVSYIAPAREISILVGILMGAYFLKEPHLKRRLWAGLIIVAGLCCLAWG